MKKILIFFVSLTLLTSVVSSDSKKLAGVKDQINYLLAVHQKAWQKNDMANGFSKHFFMNSAFTRERTANRFFRMVQANIERGAYANAGGYTMMSYTSIMSFNGKTTAVSYQFAQNGGTVHFAKQAYINGQMLKAVYDYDTNGQLMNVKEYRNNRLIQKKYLEI